jgi:tricorn protease
VEVVKAERWEITQYAWSPDSRWIAYAKPEVDMMAKVYLYSLEAKKTFAVTDSWYNSGDPSFSRDGKYLFLVSDRDFSPVYSSTEWNHAYLAMSRVYFVPLASDTKSPFEPKSDEVAVKADKAAPPVKPAKAGEKPEEKKEAAGVPAVRVDTDGLMDRIVALPVETAYYGGINAIGDAVYYAKNKPGERGASLMLYDLAELKEKDLGKFGGYEVSADGKKMLVNVDRAYGIVDLPKAPVKLETRLDLFGRHRGEVIEIETQPLGIHRRTGLTDMRTEHPSQPGLKKVGCRMVALGAAAFPAVDCQPGGMGGKFFKGNSPPSGLAQMNPPDSRIITDILHHKRE